MKTPTPTCPDSGAWRAWLDHEHEREHVSPRLAEHLAGCPTCQAAIANLREDAAAVRQALSLLAPVVVPSQAEIAVARERLSFSQSRPARSAQPAHLPPTRIHEPGVPMFLSRVPNSWRVAAGGLAAALTLSFLVTFTPEGSAAAASFLAQFRSQQVVAVEISPQSQTDIIRTLNALGNLGTVTMPNGVADPSRPRAVARGAAEQITSVSLADASQLLGFAVQTPDPATLPTGLDRSPQVRVMPASQIRFTFDKNKARQYIQSTGHPDVLLPDRFDGATLVVSIPSAAILEYGNSQTRDALIIGEAGELVVDVEGGKVSLPEMRDFLLGLPGLPPITVSQLRLMQDWNQTLPIPIPIDKVNWQSTTFKGNQGLLLNDNSGVGSAAIWHANGHMFGIAGSLRATDLKRIAESLAVTH